MMVSKEDISYLYDRSVVEVLLPHRHPFLMVDRIISLSLGQYPSLFANYTVKDNEPVFCNNETGNYWPSMYIVEGLGQCGNLLIVIRAIEERMAKAGLTKTINDVLNGFRDGESDEITSTLKDILNHRLNNTFSNVGFLGSTDLEITGHVVQGQVISYEVHQNQIYGLLFHLTVRAYVNKNLIAYGTLIGSGRR